MDTVGQRKQVEETAEHILTRENEQRAAEVRMTFICKFFLSTSCDADGRHSKQNRGARESEGKVQDGEGE